MRRSFLRMLLREKLLRATTLQYMIMYLTYDNKITPVLFHVLTNPMTRTEKLIYTQTLENTF